MRNRFHSLCPYFATFPEAFAEKWIRKLTSPGDIVLDPFSGRGTTALTALLLDREAIACDVNEVAFCLSAAKVNAPRLGDLLKRLTALERTWKAESAGVDHAYLGEFFTECFDSQALSAVLFLRSKLDWRTDRVDRMIAALVLGSLHGDSGKNSPYFSNQMPRTISMNPGYSVRYWRDRNLLPPLRDVFMILRNRADFRYCSPKPSGKAQIFNQDMRALPHLIRKKTRISCVITSPPYLNVTSFEEDQWLRLWFLGGPAQPVKGRISRDDRHINRAAYWSFIEDMWSSFAKILAEDSHIVIRLGSRSLTSAEMKEQLLASTSPAGRPVRLISSRTTELLKRQTGSFTPGTVGCGAELDCHFLMK